MRNKKKKEENLNKVGSKLNIAKERLSDLEDRSRDSPGVQYRELIRYKWLRWSQICLQCKRPGFNPWLGRSFGEGNGYPLQYFCLEASIDGRGIQYMGSQRVGHDRMTSAQHYEKEHKSHKR